MPRTAEIALDGQRYTVRALNMKELQEVLEIVSKSNDTASSGMKILRIALRRSQPPVESVDDIEPTVQELGEATTAILKLSGLDINPQPAAPAK